MRVDPKGLVRVIKYVALHTAQHLLQPLLERMDVMATKKEVQELTEVFTGLNVNITALGTALGIYIKNQQDQQADLAPLKQQAVVLADSVQKLIDIVTVASAPVLKAPDVEGGPPA